MHMPKSSVFWLAGMGRSAGRVAAIVDRNHNEFQKENAGFFGFFESTDDVEVAGAVMQAARKWLLERGAKVIRGPVNPSTNYECGCWWMASTPAPT